MQNITYRPATLDDLPILFAFEQGIVEAERPYNPTLKAGNIIYYDLEAYVKSPDIEVLVAVLGEEIIGSGYAKIKTSKNYEQHDQHAYLGFMYVKPEHRGKSRGRSRSASLRAPGQRPGGRAGALGADALGRRLGRLQTLRGEVLLHRLPRRTWRATD